MPETTASPSTKPQASMVVACLLLTACLVAVFPLFAWYGFAVHAQWGLAASACAALVCWFFALVALIVAALASRQGYGLHGALVGMIIRMAPALIAVIASKELGGELVAAGFGGQLIGFYLVALTVETLLSLRFINTATISAPSVAKVG